MLASTEILQCEAKKLTYDFEKNTGQLWVAEHQVPDLSGLGKLFSSIDDNAKFIEVFSGEKPHSSYKCSQGNWASDGDYESPPEL